MTDKTEQQAGEELEETPKLGLSLKLFYWYLLWKEGGISRDKRRSKGKPSPTKGICGSINHGEDDQPWLWLEIETARGYPMMSRDQRNRLKANFGATIKSFSGWRGGGELDIQVQAVPYDLKAIDRELKAGIVNPDKATEQILRRHAESRRRNLRYIKDWKLKERRVFIGVKLSDERSFIERLVSQLMRWMGFGSLDVYGIEQEIYRDQIQEVVAKFEDNNIRVRELTGSELARVIQRCVNRGHDTLPELPSNTDVIQSKRELQILTDSRARDLGDMVRIIQDGSVSYATYLAAAKFPEEFYLSWMFVGDRDGNPVEVSARLKVMPVEKSKSQVGTTLDTIENSLEHLYKSKGNKQDEIKNKKEQKTLGLKVQQRLQEEHPEVEVDAFLIVSSDNKTRLTRNVRSVMAKCRNMGKSGGLILQVDEANQAEIRRQCYPGTQRTYDTYRQELFFDGVAQAMPHGATIIGNDGDLHGIVRGRGAEEAPYRYNHRDVLRKKVDKKTGQVFIGPSGEGKTDAMINRAISDALANMAVIFDEGKGDTNILEEELGLLVDIKVMNLSNPNLAGMLNPLYLGDDDKESRDLTLNVLMKCTGYANQPEWEPLVAEGIDAEFVEAQENGEHPDIRRIVDRLRNAPESDPEHRTKRAIGRSIMGLMNARHSNIIFAPGIPWQEIAHEYIRRGQDTFVVYGHLTPPNSDKPDKDLSAQERLALMVRDLTNVAYYKIAMNPEVPLAIYKDEIQIDNRMGGSVSSEHLSRIGRSKNSTINLGGQFLGDIPEGFWENTATYNFFRFTTPRSAKWAIELLGINVVEGSEEEMRLIALLMDVPDNGRRRFDVIVRTYDGQIGLVAFKQIYHGGRFVSNVEGVEERRRQDLKEVGNQLTFVRRAETPEAAEQALVVLGVPAEVIANPNGYQAKIDELKATIMGLEDDERLGVDDDGQLRFFTVSDRSVSLLPMPPAEEGAAQGSNSSRER